MSDFQIKYTDEEKASKKNPKKIALAEQANMYESNVRKFISGDKTLTPDQQSRLARAVADQDYVPDRSMATSGAKEYLYCYNISYPYFEAAKKHCIFPFLLGSDIDDPYTIAKGYKPRCIFCFHHIPDEFIKILTTPIILIDADASNYEKQILWTEVSTPYPDLSMAIASHLYYEYDPKWPIQVRIKE